MIAHRIQRRSGRDNFARLGCYVLDLKRPDDPKAFERLASYITDRDSGGGGERVIGARITNCEMSSDLEEAMAEIEGTQSNNLRTTLDKSYHLIISFPEGERPTPDQLREIEDHLMAAIGFADHQRISAIHDDTDNLHVHVAVNKIHPTTHRAVEPYFDHPKLMQACRELELKHGLIIDNHGLDEDRAQGRDAAEGGGATSRNRDGAARMEAHGGRESLSTWIETHAKLQLVEAAAKAVDWAGFHSRLGDLGLQLKQRGAGFAIGADGTEAHVKASSVDPSLSFKALTGRLGVYQAPDQDRTKSEPSKQYDAGPRQDKKISAELYERFQTERSIIQLARDQAFAALGQAHAAYSKQLSAHYCSERLRVRGDHYLAPELKKPTLQTLAIAQIAAKAERRQLAIQQRAFIRQANPLSTWQGYLEREAARGDEDAVGVLRSRITSRSPEGSNILTAADRPVARHVVYQQLEPKAARNGDVTYHLGDGGKVTDRAHEVRADRSSPSAAFLALALAADRYAGQPLIIEGSEAFKAAVVGAVSLRTFKVTFADTDMEKARLAAIRSVRVDEVPDEARDSSAAYVQARNVFRSRVHDAPEYRVWTARDAGPAEYAGRRHLADGSEAVLLRDDSGVAVMPVTPRQAAKASTWATGELVITDDRGRFCDTRNDRAEGGRKPAHDLVDDTIAKATRASQLFPNALGLDR